MNSVATTFTSSTSPFKNRSRAKLAIGRASANRGESVKVNSAANCRRVRAMNCAARLPAAMNTVVAGSNCAATRNRLVLSAPHNPLSVPTRITARLRTARTSSSGWVKSRAWVVAYRWMRYSSCANGRVFRVVCWALRIFDAATICIARVICAVLVIDLMRRRSSRGLSISHHFALHFQVCLNSSAAAFNSAFNASLSSLFPSRSWRATGLCAW